MKPCPDVCLWQQIYNNEHFTLAWYSQKKTQKKPPKPKRKRKSWVALLRALFGNRKQTFILIFWQHSGRFLPLLASRCTLGTYHNASKDIRTYLWGMLHSHRCSTRRKCLTLLKMLYHQVTTRIILEISKFIVWIYGLLNSYF